MIVLDTNIASELDRADVDENVAGWLRRQDFGQLYLSGPSVMEMAFGAQRILLRSGSRRYLLALETLTQKLFSGRVLEFGNVAAERAGVVRAMREGVGRPISVVDSMIAAICLIHDATLATRNLRDFDGLDLRLVNPFEATA